MGLLLIENIKMDTAEYKIYCKLTRNLDKGFKVIGRVKKAIKH